MRLHQGLLLLALGLLSLPARADPQPVDLSDLKGELIVLQVGKNHYLVTALHQMRDRTFWGTTKQLNQLRGTSASQSGSAPDYERVSARFSDHTLGSGGSFGLDWVEGEWSLTCGDHEISAKEIGGPAAEGVLENATFMGPLWERRPLLLARDEYGIYYFVDEHIRDKAPENIHVYAGWMGQMVKTKLLLVAQDSEGSIFSTHSGDRRLLMDKEMYRWIEDDVSYPLRIVPVDANWGFIHTTLGVYSGLDFGTPCDLL